MKKSYYKPVSEMTPAEYKKYKATRDLWYEKNRDKVNEQNRDWAKKNRKKATAINKKWKKSAETNPDVALSILYSAVKGKAKERNIAFRLSKQSLLEVLIRCGGVSELSGVKLTVAPNHPNKVSIDRIDSSKGYTVSNIQMVTAYENKAKNDLNTADFIAMCKRVAERNK